MLANQKHSFSNIKFALQESTQKMGPSAECRVMFREQIATDTTQHSDVRERVKFLRTLLLLASHVIVHRRFQVSCCCVPSYACYVGGRDVARLVERHGYHTTF